MNQTNSTLADLRDSLMSHGQSVLDDLSDAATLAKDWTSAHPAISGIVGAGLILGALYGAKPSSSDRRSGCHTGNENLNNSQEVVSEGLSGDTAQQQATADWIEDWKSRAIESSIRSSLKIPKDYLPLADFNTGRSDKSVADAIAHNTKYVLSIDTDDIAKVTAAQQALIKDWSRMSDQLSHLNQTSVEPEEPEEPLEDKRSHLTKLALGTARLISTHPTTLRMPTGHTAPDDMTDYVLGSDAAQGFLRNWDRWEDSILRGKQWPLGPTKSRRVMPLPWTPKMAALILLSAWK